MNLSSKQFGTTKSNQKVYQYTITNDFGASVSVLSYGGIIQQLMVPDRHGVLSNVVLNYAYLTEYETNPYYFGALIGRNTGRLSNAQFKINGTAYLLAANDGVHNLHGGNIGFNHRLWEVGQYYTADKASLILHYTSPDGEDGFPGTVDCTVIYTFDNNHCLTISYSYISDHDTIVNLTNHSYFNLSGDFSRPITDHQLLIQADQYLELDTDLIPLRFCPVDQTSFDFKKPKPVGRDITNPEPQLIIGNGYDHPYRLNNISAPAITLSDPASGRRLEVSTNNPCVVLYTGNFLNSSIVTADGFALTKHSGLCLETQLYPNYINADFMPDLRCLADTKYNTTTAYRFSTIE